MDDHGLIACHNPHLLFIGDAVFTPPEYVGMKSSEWWRSRIARLGHRHLQGFSSRLMAITGYSFAIQRVITQLAMSEWYEIAIWGRRTNCDKLLDRIVANNDTSYVTTYYKTNISYYKYPIPVILGTAHLTGFTILSSAIDNII